MDFLLSRPNAIDGEQLASEIAATTGIILSRYDLIFYPPDRVEIREYMVKDRDEGVIPPGRAVEDIALQRETIQAVVTAHTPTPAGTVRGRTREGMRTTAQSAVGVQADVLNRQQLDSLLRCLLFKFNALDDTGSVRPLDGWL